MSEQTPTNEPILVIGATGRQGGAVARHLLNSGFRVRALTRDPNKQAAQALAGLNIDVVKGDLSDRASLEQAMKGAYGVFSVQDFWQAGYDGEISQGRLAADVARSIGVQHFVYSSVAGADRETGLPHFDSKWIVEQHVHQLGLPATILRPVFFMENWGAYVREPILSGTLPQPLTPERSLQQVATDDIGAFAEMAFCNGGKWLGRVVEIAGDEPTMEQTAQAFSRALGRPVRYQQTTWEDFERSAGEEMARMYRWFQDVGYTVNIEQLRKEHPNLRTLPQFLGEESWIRAEAPAATLGK